MTKPTIVLVHGAFADGASWAPVTRELLDRGFPVRVPGSPNRSLIGDAAYIRQFVSQIEGPVVLAGHSYGSAVISIAGDADNVVALVFVTGYVPEVGETLGELQGRFASSPLAEKLVLSPIGTEGAMDVSVDVEAFPDLFALGVDRRTAEVLAVSQRPLAAAVFDEPAPVAAWKTKPAWGIVGAKDRTINPEVERFGYQRASLRGLVELDSPHLAMLAFPTEVADVITEAATTVSDD